jgi:hypothetical protein
MSLSTGDPNKLVKGADHDTEYDAIETAVNTKLDQYSGATALTALDDDADDGADVLSVYDDGAGAYKKITVANARPSLALGAATLCKATLSADQTGFADAATDIVEFDQTDFDIGSDFDTTTDEWCFVAPADGYYLMQTTLIVKTVGVVDGSIKTTALWREPAAGGGFSVWRVAHNARDVGSAGTAQSMNTTMIEFLSQNDRVQVRALWDFNGGTGTLTSDLSGQKCAFTILRVG